MDGEKHDPIWSRVFLITRRPKSYLLARQILDPAYFTDLHRFCERVAETYIRRVGFFISADEVESVARFWADEACIKPADESEAWVFNFLNRYSTTFAGWVASPEAAIKIFLPQSDESSDED